MKKKNPEFTELGLEAIEINGEWHYVKEKVNTEVVRLRAELTECERKYYQNLTELAQTHLRELDKRDAEIASLHEENDKLKEHLGPRCHPEEKGG